MGLAIEGNNIGIYKACIKDADKLKDLTLPSLFGESNRLNLGPVPSFLPILTTVEELLIAYIYIFICKLYIYTASNIAILAISAALARIYQRLGGSYYGYLLSLIY